MRRYLRDGALAGLSGGAALALVLRLLGHGSIERAVELERAGAGTAPDELFGRAAQQLAGTAAAAIYGVAMGLVFAVAFAALRHRTSAPDDWHRSVRLGAVALATVFLVPFAKYPANPPAVGDPDTIADRTALYLVMLAWSSLATWSAWRAWRWLETKAMPAHLRDPAAALLYVALVAAGLALLPPNPDAVAAPASLIWSFRLSTVAGAVAYWGVTGVTFGWLRLAATGVDPLAPLRRRSPTGEAL